MSSPLLCLRNIYAGYKAKTVVKDVSFEVRAGEFCALLGLNGSGKTTLLKAVCGLLPLKGGSCLVEGTDCTELSEYKRARYISYIPQRHSKLAGVCVLDAVLMGFYSGLGVFEFPSAQDKRLARAALEDIGFAHLEAEDFSKLSEGQKQMVILVRTLIQNTPVMLMDEPDSALDFLNRRKMLGAVRELVHSQGKAGLVTLHEPGLALEYCDRLVLIDDGEIVSNLDLTAASGAEIEACLSKIYGDITLLKHENSYVMFSR